MLSNPTKTLHNRQRQHRRQNSTPTAFDPVKANNLPNIQKHGAHRRGMSLDQRQRPTPPQDLMVSNTNNQGYQTTQQQHTLRETQQQRLVRPGQHFNLDNDENYISSPAVTPQRQSFDAGPINYAERAPAQPQYNNYSGPISGLTYVDPNTFSGANDFNLFGQEGILTPSAFLDFSAEFSNSNGIANVNNGSRRSSAGRRISGGILGRVAQFEDLALQSPHRPITPPNQNISSYFPPTPIDTPHDRMIKQEQMNQRFLDSYDISMEDTIKPKSNQRARGVFEDMRREAEKHSGPSLPHSRSMPMVNNFDSAPMPTANFMNMSTLDMEFLKNEPPYNDQQQYSPVAADPSPAVSYHSSPEISQRTLKGAQFTNTPSFNSMSYPELPSASCHSVPDTPSRSPHRRSESVDSLNIDEAITDTGITIDDIATFIQGPDPMDGKWMCLYPECGKRFGRKENIKSHVQTHLGDRQFQCPHCQKCFVRQHDLKRHAKIHSGVKPYPCQCGNSFARHDALTRHRQRGMCIGAFEGVVKKTVKRGRPRKARPDDEDRLKKSSRTRSKNKASSSASSSAGGSDSSVGGNSPRSDIELLHENIFGDYQYPQATPVIQSQHDEYAQSPSPVAGACIPPIATQNVNSPAAYNSHSNYSGNASVSEHLPSPPRSPAGSQHSQYHSPPGLCDSSSSPAPSNYYDMDNVSSHGERLQSLTLANISEHDDEIFLEAFAAAGATSISQLERDPDMLMSKFDDNFANTSSEDIFKDEADVFFGSP